MAELRGDEMKMSVPGDAGYEVERFAEKKVKNVCFGCPKVNTPDCAYPIAVKRDGGMSICPFAPDEQPKSSPVLGETVLTGNLETLIYEQLKSEMGNIAFAYSQLSIEESGKYIKAVANTLFQLCYYQFTQQDSHTRKCLKEQGWKSPEEVERIERGWEGKALREINLVRNTVESNTRRKVAEAFSCILLDARLDYDERIIKARKLIAELEANNEKP